MIRSSVLALAAASVVVVGSAARADTVVDLTAANATGTIN